MLKFLKTYKVTIFILSLIGLIYFFIRIPNLTLQPIFCDEAIYIRWAQVMKAEPTLRFLSLTDGKTPLFMWLMAPFFKVFSDPLFAGRLLSVLSGFVTLLGVVFMGWKFFNPRVALWAGLLMAITPFIVFFDRMALVDSMLAAFSIWSLNLALLVIVYQRLDLAMFLGYLLGGGLLTKTPGMFSFLTIPVTLISFKWLAKDHDRQLVKIFLLWIVAGFIGMIIYNILRLGPGFEMLSSRNQDYIHSPLEILKHPLDPFIPHFRDLLDWLPKLLTIPTLLLVLAGIVLAFIKRNVIALTILAWGILPLLANMAMLQTFTARYILFSIPPLLIVAAWAIDTFIAMVKLHSVLKVGLVVLFVTAFSAVFDFQLLTNPTLAPLPQAERRGYLEDWTAGYGFPEIAKYLINESQKGLVVVGTEGYFGTLPEGLQIYLDKHSHTASSGNQVIVIPGKPVTSTQLQQAAIDHPTFYVVNKLHFLAPDNLQLIKEYPKAAGDNTPADAVLLFKVLPVKSK